MNFNNDNIELDASYDENNSSNMLDDDDFDDDDNDFDDDDDLDEDDLDDNGTAEDDDDLDASYDMSFNNDFSRKKKHKRKARVSASSQPTPAQMQEQYYKKYLNLMEKFKQGTITPIETAWLNKYGPKYEAYGLKRNSSQLNPNSISALNRWAPYVDNTVSYMSQKMANPVLQQQVLGSQPTTQQINGMMNVSRIPTSVIGLPSDRPGGWLLIYWSKLVRAGALSVMVGKKGRIATTTASISRHAYSSVKQLYDTACATVAGATDKKFTDIVYSAAGVATVSELTGVEIFAVLLRGTCEFQKQVAQIVPVKVEYGFSSYSDTQNICVIPSLRNGNFEALILLPGNNSGIGVLKKSNQCKVTIAADKIPVGYSVTLESVNLRDI